MELGRTLVNTALRFEAYTNNAADKRINEADELNELAHKCAELYYKVISSSDKGLDFSDDPEMRELIDELTEKGIIDVEGYKFNSKQITSLTGKLRSEESNLTRQANAILQYVPDMLNRLMEILRISNVSISKLDRFVEKVLAKMHPNN